MAFTCAEQFMMYCKAQFFGAVETAAKIMSTKHPRDQKALGRLVTPFNADIWNQEARNVVYVGSMYKFAQNVDLREYLLDSGTDVIVEASPEDRIWGIGYDEHYAMANIDDWGTNWLGEVLMQVRENLKRSEMMEFYK